MTYFRDKTHYQQQKPLKSTTKQPFYRRTELPIKKILLQFLLAHFKNLLVVAP